ncbi:MAG: hypothetical protein ACI9Y1_002047 [Lentisphaeria bacterium]
MTVIGIILLLLSTTFEYRYPYMPRKIFKRYSPDPHKLRKIPALKIFGVLLHDPNLFHLNRHSVSMAFFVGLFIAFLPIPFQLPIAAFGAVLFRCNLPITVTLIWVSNPITIPFIVFLCYKFGATLLHIPEKDLSFELSLAWFQSEFLIIWQPLLLGCFLASLFFGCSGYVTIQWIWRWHVVKRWEKRKLRRLQKETTGTKENI